MKITNRRNKRDNEERQDKTRIETTTFPGEEEAQKGRGRENKTKIEMIKCKWHLKSKSNRKSESKNSKKA